MTSHKGRRRCRTIRFEANTDPFHTSYCHCSDCRQAIGEPGAYTDAWLGDQIFKALGAMDHSENYPPIMHGYVSEQLPFFYIDDGLPRQATTTVPRPDGA